MKWLNLDIIKNSSVYITPNLPVVATKRYKVSLLQGLLYISLYTIACWLILILILSSTPLKDMLFVVDNSAIRTQNEKIEKLQNRVIMLTQELQTISTSSERLKYAIKLAQKDSINSKNPLYDTLRKPINKKLKIEGNVFGVIKSFFEKLFQNNSNTNKIIFFEPAQGMVTQKFDASTGHLGIDYGVRAGSPVYATAGGLVTFSGYTVDYGYMIIIQHSDNYISFYKHCSSLIKKTHDIVTQGELIALSGNSGRNTTGQHLHFEIWHQGKAVDPQSLLIK